MMRDCPATEQVLRLPDGARIGYGIYGDPRGRPLLFFHGWPGSRLQGAMADSPARDLGWRVIAIDRPGIGLTRTPEPFTLTKWPQRVAQLLDHLELARCHLLAISGGAPSALACASILPDRFVGLGIACGAASIAEAPSLDGLLPFFRLLLTLDRKFPSASLSLLDLIRRYLEAMPAEHAMSFNRPLLPKADRRVFADPEVRRMLVLSMREGFRQGPSGLLSDGRAIAAQWGFDWRHALDAVPTALWHGDADGTIPLHLAEWAAEEMNVSDRLEVFPGEGHFSLPIARCSDLLRRLPEQA